MWLPVFLCACGRPVAGADPAHLRCDGCGAFVEQRACVFRCLDDSRKDRLRPFVEQYRFVRERDGYRDGRAEYYRALPRVEPADPQRSIWRVRERSFRRLCRELRAPLKQAPVVLDLGAGSGWLSHRLTLLGCRAVAVDLLADEQDGLGACRHYDEAFACVEADFDALPFAPRQFDLVVFNGSLHYSPDVAATLRHAASMLKPGGRVAVIDSPMFSHAVDGRAMRRRDRERLHAQYGLPSPIQPGEGFLTFERLAAWAASAGRRSPQFFSTHDGWRRRLARAAASCGLTGAKPARFGVWVAA